MKTPSTAWQRLAAAARQAPDTRDSAAPYGFATRVAANAFTAERPGLLTLVGRFSLPALVTALALMAVSIVANYPSLNTTAETEQELLDPVAEVLTLS